MDSLNTFVLQALHLFAGVGMSDFAARIHNAVPW